MAQGRVETMATLRIECPDTSPEGITAILGIRPTQELKKGERVTASPRSAISRSNVWLLDSELPSSESLANHVDFLLTAIEASSWMVSRPAPSSVSMVCTITSGQHQSGFGLPHSLLRRLGSMSISFECTILSY